MLLFHLAIFPNSAPGSFGRTEAHASHGRIITTAKPQSRATIVTRVSGPPLDGGESEGNLTGYTGRVDCERLSPPNVRGRIFLAVPSRCAIRGRRHSSTTWENHA